MSIDRESSSAPASLSQTGAALGALPARLAGVALSLGVAVIHVMDQGGFPGDKEPRYVGIGYYLIELAALAVAVLLLLPGSGRELLRTGWVLAVGVAIGPLLGYVLSRGPGLPDYTDDKGVWFEPIGVISLVLEAVLALLALSALAGRRTSDV